MTEATDLARLRTEREESLAEAAARTKAEIARRSKFRLVPFHEIQPSAGNDYIIKGVLPRTGLAVIWGKPKTGKSFLTSDMMLHVAAGWSYQGRRVQQNPVVYLPLEGTEGFRRRIEAFRRKHAAALVGKSMPFYIVPATLDLITERDELEQAITAALAPILPAAIVIDTLNRSLRGDENSAEDMAAYVRAADMLRAAFDCLVIVVHHCGVNGDRPRGSTALTGAADTQIQVERLPDRTIRATVEYQKDGAEGDALHARLEVVEIGMDADGEAITSCVVTPAEPTTEQATKAVKLSAPCSLALSALRQAVDEAGEVPPASNHIPAGVKVVSAELWRRYAYAKNISDGEQNAKRMAFKRAAEQLQARGIVGCWQDKAWPC